MRPCMRVHTCMLSFCSCVWQVSVYALIYTDNGGVFKSSHSAPLLGCLYEMLWKWIVRACVWMLGFALLQVWELFSEYVQLYGKV